MSATSHIASSSTYFDKVLETLHTSGFYWGAINADQSNRLLLQKTIGTFLVRASSNPKHLFTLSLKTARGVTHIRIIMCDGKFLLDQNVNNGNAMCSANRPTTLLRFDCVVKMIFYYMLVWGQRRFSSSTRSRDNGWTLCLTAPLYKEVCSLKHLSRVKLNRHFGGDGIHKMSIPPTLKSYLKRYQYPF